MNPMTPFYPATPGNVPASVTAPSAAFKSEVSKVMGSILLFFVVYILLVLLAVGLAAGAVYGGIALIVAIPRIITIMVGVGLIGLGIMVFFFLIKFIFAVTRFDKSNSIEIKESDHPKLFAFIRQLTKDTQTPFPKRIYLSPEVNACVFYDSGFWSMFLPVKKNLQIGLGLVNSVNLSEFKAVMAHEFGHFSQRSMKLGSFVYNVNRVIYNMLFENTGYSRALQSWGNASAYFAFFANITVYIVNGIQWVLQKMYGVINKNYMSLSREMEFHADAVSASVSGSSNCVNALRRIELAGSCYNVVINKCDTWLTQKYAISNLYLNQQTVFKQYADEFKLTLQNHLPVVTQEFIKNTQQNRVNFKDQWASHPTLEEREENLNRLQVIADTAEESAWVLFENAAEWQHRLTEKIYTNINISPDIQKLDKEAFDKKFWKEVEFYTLPEVYNNFYDGREITMLDVEALSSGNSITDQFDTIFTAEHGTLNKRIRATENDIELLKSISQGSIQGKTFDFDGEKYKSEQAAEFIPKLEEELKAMKEQLELLDKKAYQYFYQKALAQSVHKATQLKEAYDDYFTHRKQSQQYLDEVNKMLEPMGALFGGHHISVAWLTDTVNELKRVHEPAFKKQLTFWMSKGIFEEEPALKTRIQQFIDSNYLYFSEEQFFSNEFSDLHVFSNETWRIIVAYLFRKFKAILETQIHYTN